MSNVDENDNNRFKCHLCPAKSYMRAKHVKCEKCNARYHKACALRAGKQSNGSFNSCCGKIAAASNSQQVSNDSQVVLTSKHDLDLQQFSPLKDWLQPYLDLFTRNFDELRVEITKQQGMLEDVVERLDDHDEKINAITDELHELRENVDNQSVNHLLVVKELKEQMKKEKNFLIYNFPDHKDAYKTDTKSIKDLIINYSDLDLPFNKHTIRTSRVGKFKNENCRPLVVYLKNKEHVHWFFKNKRYIS